MNGQKE